MHERLNKVRKDNPDFDKRMIDDFAKRMPDLLSVMIDGTLYDNHIGSREVAMLAEPFIVDDEDNKIGFHWTYDEVMNAVRGYVDFDKEEFYEADLFTWLNIRYGDLGHIETSENKIIEIAISELSDKDFPYFPSSQRAYKWLKKHIENNSQ